MNDEKKKYIVVAMGALFIIFFLGAYLVVADNPMTAREMSSTGMMYEEMMDGEMQEGCESMMRGMMGMGGAGSGHGKHYR